jgi:hypothetical protein
MPSGGFLIVGIRLLAQQQRFKNYEHRSSPQTLFNTITKKTPTVSYDLIINSQGAGDWQSDVSCVLTSKGYNIVASAPGQYMPCMLQNTTYQYRDFAFQVQMLMASDGSGGLIFRSDQKISKFYRFSVDTGGNYVLILCTACNDKNLTSGQPPSRSGTLDHPDIHNQYTLTVIAIKNTIYLYIDGAPVYPVSNAINSTGEIGLYAAASTNQPVTVVFTKAMVWKL